MKILKWIKDLFKKAWKFIVDATTPLVKVFKATLSHPDVQAAFKTAGRSFLSTFTGGLGTTYPGLRLV